MKFDVYFRIDQYLINIVWHTLITFFLYSNLVFQAKIFKANAELGTAQLHLVKIYEIR